ncbi:MAG: arginine repressor [Marvinbryantia sp.]|jgi:transcriptional regulator of arginine metabolism
MKIERHAKIVEIINQYDIETQEELADRLKQAGFRVTQATISRDIRELKLTKMSADGGRQKYVVMGSHSRNLDEKYLRVLRDGFLSMDMAQNILVIRTVSGMAMAVAAAMDAMHFNEIAGCIAGDDTIMCAVRSIDDTLIVMDKLRRILDSQ